MTKPHVLSFESYDDWDMNPMNDMFTVHAFPSSGNPLDLPPETREQIRAFAFKGHDKLGSDIIGAFPNLGLIANYGVGYDTIDVAFATSKGIKVTNTPDVLTNDVADLAVGMLIALSRDIVGAASWVSSGNWATSGAYPLQRTLSDTKVGIAGLGRIGQTIARRLQGFDMQLHYYSRTEKKTDGLHYHSSITELADEVDILIVAVSGGPDTAGIVSEEVLAALGSDGVLVNISRGSTVNEEALIQALEQKRIRAAALDVYNNEPDIDSRLLQLDNILLQPHQSSGTIETRKKMGELQRQNMLAFFADKPLVTPVN